MFSVSHAWVSEPDGQGTWEIIQTCLLTLLLCIYTAIHFNIRPHQSERQSWFRRIKVSLLASAVPEFLFIYAIYQWNCAKRLQTRLNNLQNEVSMDSDVVGRLD